MPLMLIVSIIAVTLVAGAALSTVLLSKQLESAARMKWIMGIAVVEGVVLAGLIVPWLVLNMGG